MAAGQAQQILVHDEPTNPFRPRFLTNRNPEYKFHGSCACCSYVAKPKSLFTSWELPSWHLEEIEGMLCQHRNSKGCRYTGPVQDHQIWCFEGDEGCQWVHERNTPNGAAGSRPPWAAGSAGSAPRITRARSMHTTRNRSRSPRPVRPPITMNEVKAWLISPNCTISELASINAFTANAIHRRLVYAVGPA